MSRKRRLSTTATTMCAVDAKPSRSIKTESFDSGELTETVATAAALVKTITHEPEPEHNKSEAIVKTDNQADTTSTTTSSTTTTTTTKITTSPVPDEYQIAYLLTIGLSSADGKVVWESLNRIADSCSKSRAGDCAKRNASFIHQNNNKNNNNTNGVRLVIHAMKHWGRSEVKIQTAGTRALQNIMCHHVDARATLLELGGVDVIVNNMFEHDRDRELQRSSCGALWNFVIDDAKRKQAVVQAGGVTALVAALLAFPAEVRLQHWACESLLRLCTDTSNETSCSSTTSNDACALDAISRTLEVGGLGAVVAAYENLRDNVKIRISSAKLMKILMDRVEIVERLRPA